jgi:hypothetical protein
MVIKLKTVLFQNKKRGEKKRIKMFPQMMI